MSGKVRAIREATLDQVGVLEGWGGMYMLDLIPAGICGLMPGLGAADLLQTVWTLGTGGRMDDALDLFEKVLPQLSFSLQNMELFLCLEKRLLATRGVLAESSTHVRRPTWTPDSETLATDFASMNASSRLHNCSVRRGQLARVPARTNEGPAATRWRNFRAENDPFSRQKRTRTPLPVGFSAFCPIFPRGSPLKKRAFPDSPKGQFPRRKSQFLPPPGRSPPRIFLVFLWQKGGSCPTTENSLSRTVPISLYFHKYNQHNVLRIARTPQKNRFGSKHEVGDRGLARSPRTPR